MRSKKSHPNHATLAFCRLVLTRTPLYGAKDIGNQFIRLEEAIQVDPVLVVNGVHNTIEFAIQI